MHGEVRTWLGTAIGLVTPYLEQTRADVHVVDLGSRDVNGSPVELLPPGWRYLGVDERAGKGVDVVADAASWTPPPSYHVDLVLCLEVLEHARSPWRIVHQCERILRAGGVLLLTCAGMLRAPHGVDGAALQKGEEYHGVTQAELQAWLGAFALKAVEDRQGIDLYALAVKGV